jgi:DNA (cytosine-5)-methyltransferase 1
MGYTLAEPLFVTAESIGASHRRERVFVLAYRAGVQWFAKQRREPDGDFGAVADSRIGNAKRRGIARNVAGASEFSGRRSEVADAERSRPQRDRPAIAERRHFTFARDTDRRIFAPGPSADWASIPEHLWPAVEPGFRVLVDGDSVVLDQSRVDQLRCGGNGCVPLAAAVAFVELMRKARDTR